MEENTNTGAVRPLTYGEKAVGLTFNPGGNEKVNQIKKLYAEIIDLCHEGKVQSGQTERGRIFSIAITEAQSAQMWAVKAVTWMD